MRSIPGGCRCPTRPRRSPPPATSSSVRSSITRACSAPTTPHGRQPRRSRGAGRRSRRASARCGRRRPSTCGSMPTTPRRGSRWTGATRRSGKRRSSRSFSTRPDRASTTSSSRSARPTSSATCGCVGPTRTCCRRRASISPAWSRQCGCTAKDQAGRPAGWRRRRSRSPACDRCRCRRRSAIPPAAGDAWRFNVFRIKRPNGPMRPKDGAILAAWSPTGTPSFHVPAAFQALTFG